MAKERKQRRALRQAESQRLQQEHARLQARRAKRQELWRRLSFHEFRRRSSGRVLARRSQGERAFVGVMTVLVLFVVWSLAPSLALKIALSLLFILALPVLVIVAFDRRNS